MMRQKSRPPRRSRLPAAGPAVNRTLPFPAAPVTLTGVRERRRKAHREKDITRKYLEGGFEEVEQAERFTTASKHAEKTKILRTAQLRADEVNQRVATLPIGRVIQVYSLFSEVERIDDPQRPRFLCTTRKTLARTSKTQVVVGDEVRFQPTGTMHETGYPEAVIEHIEPRRTVLTRADSFKAIEQHPIVANAEQMLIVVSLWAPFPRWGLIDRMLVAAQAGSLVPIVCLNKIDLADSDPEARQQMDFAQIALAHYASLGIATVQTSVEANVGIDALREILRGRITVLAGHSGVGKSSLVRAVEPSLDIRIGDVSAIHLKGKHTTTSARRYDLPIGGAVIDTPGVKLFGLWGVTRDNLDDFFPDVAAGTAPDWRVESHRRIYESLPDTGRRGGNR